MSLQFLWRCWILLLRLLLVVVPKMICPFWGPVHSFSSPGNIQHLCLSDSTATLVVNDDAPRRRRRRPRREEKRIPIPLSIIIESQHAHRFARGQHLVGMSVPNARIMVIFIKRDKFGRKSIGICAAFDRPMVR